MPPKQSIDVGCSHAMQYATHRAVLPLPCPSHQVRRSTYHEVLKLHEAEDLLDIEGGCLTTQARVTHVRRRACCHSCSTDAHASEDRVLCLTLPTHQQASSHTSSTAPRCSSCAHAPSRASQSRATRCPAGEKGGAADTVARQRHSARCWGLRCAGCWRPLGSMPWLAAHCPRLILPRLLLLLLS